MYKAKIKKKKLLKRHKPLRKAQPKGSEEKEWQSSTKPTQGK